MKDHATHHPIIEQVPFADCVLSDLNPRREVDPDAITRLAENIRTLGLIHNLAGLQQEDGRVAIVAGGRRLRALEALQEDPRFHSIPVQIAPDEATARQWAATENHLREKLHPADEIENYAALAQTGAKVPDIALAFGVGERHVYRRLALAQLPKPILAALRSNEITLSMAACFTVANDETRALEVLERVSGQAVNERQIKAMLQPDAVASSDRRAQFVGKEAYLEAGGRITSDLFADADFWLDVDLLGRLFIEALTTAAEAERAAGSWLWADIEPGPYLGWYEIDARNCARVHPEPAALSDDDENRLEALTEQADTDGLSSEDAEDLARLEALSADTYSDAQKAHAGLVCYVDQGGDLQVCAGLVRPEDRKEAIEAGVLARSHHETASSKPRPMISAALASDLAAVERGARQSMLLDHPDLLLDLLAFHLSGKSGFARSFALRTDHVEVMPSTKTGYDPDPRLEGATGSADTNVEDAAQAFKRFRKQSKDRRQDTLVRSLAALIDPIGEGLRATLDQIVKLNVRASWTPTAENFFRRVPASYLDTLWQEFLSLSPDHPRITTFTRLKKREKAEKLEDLIASVETQEAHGLAADQRVALASWLPDPDA